MSIGHWIGGALGFITGTGPLGIVAGAVLGGLVESWLQNDGSSEMSNEARGERNGFLFSLVVLAAYVVQADGRVMHSEMQLLRHFLRENFGEEAVPEGEEIVRRLHAQRKQIEDREGLEAYERFIAQCCREMAQHMSHEVLLQLLSFLCDLAKADGQVHIEEIQALYRLAERMGIDQQEVHALLNLGEDGLEAAYAVLEIPETASDEEVRRAYKRLALQHHPDKVASLGEDIRRAAEKKFQEIGQAKERIYKARGMR